MDFRNFDAGLLVALDALLAEKSVTRAGNRLNLSQPATSIILARLRRYFGNELLVPAGRRMVLTPLAESLIQPVHCCLVQIQHAVASKAEFTPSTSSRKFRIAISDYVAAVLITQVMQEAARQAPRIKFELIRPPFSVPKVTHCLQWHRYQDQDPGHIWFRDLIKRVSNNIGPAPRPESVYRQPPVSNYGVLGVPAKVFNGRIDKYTFKSLY